jgi:hypothetical protein
MCCHALDRPKHARRMDQTFLVLVRKVGQTVHRPQGSRILRRISFVGEDRGTGHRLHVNGGMIGVFVPKGGSFFLSSGTSTTLMTYTSGTPTMPRTWAKMLLTWSNTFVAMAVSRVRGVYSGSLLLEAQLSSSCFCCPRRSMVPLY